MALKALQVFNLTTDETYYIYYEEIFIEEIVSDISNIMLQQEFDADDDIEIQNYTGETFVFSTIDALSVDLYRFLTE